MQRYGYIGILVLFVVLILLGSCTKESTPTEPPPPPAEAILEAYEIDTMGIYGSLPADFYPVFSGRVRNVGTATAEILDIEIYVYEDTAKTKLLGSDWDSLPDLAPGVSTPFEVIFWDLYGIFPTEIKAYEIKFLYVD